MTETECSDNSNGTCSYSVMIQSDDTQSGEFIVAVYDISGSLIGINTKFKTIDKAEHIIDSITIDGTPHTYKVFFWSDLKNLVPLCENAEGPVIK